MENGQYDRVPPYNRQAEMAVLGSILLNNDALRVVESIIEPHDFFIPEHKIIFQSMVGLADNKIPIDAVTLGNKLIEDKQIDRVGGVMFLGKLTEDVVTVANVEHHASIIREKSAIRAVLYAAQKVVEQGYRNDGEGVLADRIESVVAASDRMHRSRMPMSIFELGQGVLDSYNRVASGYRGIPLAWPTLDRMTAGMWPKTMTMFVARPSTGKCIRGDTLVMDPLDGVYRPVSEVVETRRHVLTRGSRGNVRTVLPSAHLSMGKKECLRVRLDSGREISGTPEHPVMTVDGWRRLDEISRGDHLEVVRKVPEPEFVEEPSDSEVILLAAFLADGGYTSERVSFSKQDEAILSIVRRACDDFDVELRKTSGMSACDWDVRWKASLGFGRNLGPNPARVLLDKYECGHRKSRDKVVPEKVFSFSNEKLALFLGVFFGCDGYVDSSPGVTLASREMVFQLQRLLLRFGVLGSVRYKESTCNGKKFDAWRFSAYASSTENFRSNIRLFSEHKQMALEAMSPSNNPNVDNIPITPLLKERLIDVVGCLSTKERVEKYEHVSRLLGMGTRFSLNKIYRRRTVSRRIFSAFVDVFGVRDEFGHLLANHWDCVKSIEDDGVQDVYDLTVDGTHSFVANDIVVHNTFVAIIEARYAWLQGYRVLIVSPEMSREEIAERFFVLSADVSYRDLIHGQLSSMALPRLQETVEQYKVHNNLWIMDSDDDLSPRGLDAAIRACKPHLVATDSLYDLHIKGDRRDRMLGGLEWSKRSCKHYDYAACNFGQQNRKAEESEKKGGGARLGTIALADEIGQDAHAVFALEQSKDDKADRKLHFRALKIRRGEMSYSRVTVDWDFDKMLYSEVPEEEKDGYEDVDGENMNF